MTDRPRPKSDQADRSHADGPNDPAPRHCRMLPHPAPEHETTRMLLFAFRRMAQHGLRDAVAAERMLGHFGAHFRAPLILLRAFVLELAQKGERNIAIAHCCTPRMTADEAAILAVMDDPETSAPQLTALLGGADAAHARQIAECLTHQLAGARA